VTTILHKRVERRPLATPAQLEALDGLIDAANGDATPCRDRPAWWGTDPPRAAKARAAWHAQREALCDACPVLAQCKALLGTGMRVDGFTAGAYYDDGRVIDLTPQLVHGGQRAYSKHGCRCEPCRVGEAARRARRRAREAAAS